MPRSYRTLLLSGWFGGSMLAVASIGGARGAPLAQTMPDNLGPRVERVGCWWVYGAWGPHRVCRGEDYDDGHYDWHRGHWDRHYDHYDYHVNGGDKMCRMAA